MKKLYRSKGTVHPIVSDHMSFLPATILSLAADLSLEDREVLAYLISCSNNNNDKTKSGEHAARFKCSCFRCYTSYWVRWDQSPNRELIHDIIDDFEFGLLNKAAGPKYDKKDKKHNNKRSSGKGSESSSLNNKKDDDDDDQLVKGNMVEEITNSCDSGDEESKGSVRSLVSFLGDKLWSGVWN